MVRSLACVLGVCFVFSSAVWGQTGIPTGGTTGNVTGSTGNTGNFNNSGSNGTNSNQGSTNGQLNPDNLGLNEQNFFQGGLQRTGTIGPSRQTVQGFSVLESTQSQGMNGSQSAFGSTASRNQQSRTGANGGRSGRTSFSGGNLGSSMGSGGMLGGVNRSGSSSSTTTRRMVRTRVEVSPELRATTDGTATTSTYSSVYLPGQAPQLSGVRVEVDRGVAVVSGRVSSAGDKDLSRRLMLLEPGVETVEDRVVVGAPARVTPVR